MVCLRNAENESVYYYNFDKYTVAGRKSSTVHIPPVPAPLDAAFVFSFVHFVFDVVT